jgi:muramidase (phage lysozyme)
MTPNQKAFLDLIAYSEIGPELLAVSDNGYNVIVGSTPEKPLLFTDYSDHPNMPQKFVNGNATIISSAAGRYQLLHRYWVEYRSQLGLPDFSPDSQDAVALQQIKECRAFIDIETGMIANAISKCAHIWASLPGANYGQHENTFGKLIAAYTDAGGSVA